MAFQLFVTPDVMLAACLPGLTISILGDTYSRDEVATNCGAEGARLVPYTKDLKRAKGGGRYRLSRREGP